MRAPTDRARLEALISHQRSDGRRSLAASFRECDRLERQVLEDGHPRPPRLVPAQFDVIDRVFRVLEEGLITADLRGPDPAMLPRCRCIVTGGRRFGRTLRTAKLIEELISRQRPPIVSPAPGEGFSFASTRDEAKALAERMVEEFSAPTTFYAFDELFNGTTIGELVGDVEAERRAERTSKLIDELEEADLARRSAFPVTVWLDGHGAGISGTVERAEIVRDGWNAKRAHLAISGISSSRAWELYHLPRKVIVTMPGRTLRGRLVGARASRTDGKLYQAELNIANVEEELLEP